MRKLWQWLVSHAVETRVSVVILVVFGFLMFIPLLGTHPVISADEGQRVYPPLEMLRTGDWVVPRLNGEDYLKKPPLLYWQIAVLYKLFGVSEFMARLVPALSGILFSLVVWLWARLLAGRGLGLVAGLIAAGNYFVLQKARESQLDMPLGLMAVICLGALWVVFLRIDAQQRSAEHGEAQSPAFQVPWPMWVWMAIAMVSLAAGLMYKGPVPWLMVGCAWVGACIATRRYRWVLHWRIWLVLLVSAVPLVAWALEVVREMGLEHTLAIWNREAERHLVTATKINSGSPVFYVSRILALLLPWSVATWVFFKRDFYRSLFREPVAVDPPAESGTAAAGYHLGRPTAGFLLGGAFGSFVVLSCIPAKETEYLLGMIGVYVIMLALALGWWADRKAWSSQFIARAAFVSAALWLGVVYGPYNWYMARDARRTQVVEIANYANQAMKRGVPVACYGMEATRPNLFFYLDRITPNLQKPQGVADFFAQNPDGLVFLRTKRMDNLEDFLGTKLKVVKTSPQNARVVLVAHP